VAHERGRRAIILSHERNGRTSPWKQAARIEALRR